MIKTILLILIALQSYTLNTFSQFTKTQIDELTALGISSAIEPENQYVKTKTAEVTKNYKEDDYIKRFCAVFDHINSKWSYQRDPGGMEYFEKAGVSILTYAGDCDDYATLIVSMIKSLGGEGRVVCVSGHAYPEVYIGKNLSETELDEYRENINSYYESKGSRRRVKYLNYHRGPEGNFWLNMDYQEKIPGGDLFEHSPYAEHLVIYSDGNYELAYLNR